MTVVYDATNRVWPQSSGSALCLEDRFEILKEIGDGSFGSVALARVRSAGAQVARRGTLVSCSQCDRLLHTNSFRLLSRQ
jgi:meiosis induction protein kinase IME2/SME1